MALIKEQKHDLSMGELVIANATIQDASDLIQFIKQVDSETNFLMREAHEFNLTVEQEIHFIDSNLKNEKDLLITAKLNGKIVGTLGFSCQSLSRYKHKGRFGISILRDYWGYGIGSILMKTLIEWTDQNDIVKITLEVDSDNDRAIALYKKFGFLEEGLLKYDKYIGNQQYKDSVIMARLNYSNL